MGACLERPLDEMRATLNEIDGLSLLLKDYDLCRSKIVSCSDEYVSEDGE